MKRREFITLLGGAAAWMSPARAQEPRKVIGILTSFDFASLLSEAGMPAFVQGLKDAGFVEGRNINFEIRQAADGHYDRLPSLAAELVGRNVAAIFAADLPSAFAAKAATKTIPIVFASGADPVKVGLVDSLSRPKDNLTGITVVMSLLGPKRVELLHELLPAANTIALLANPGNVNIKTDEPEIRAAADGLKQHLEVLTASTESDLEAAFATMVQHRVGSLIVMPDPFFISRGKQLVALAARHAMPAIYPTRIFTDLGGLMSYGGNLVDLYQQAGIYVGKILKGAKPADFPIQQSTKVELVINLMTAKALGLTIPPIVLARADEVIE
jgi:putative tryptophan/tyrosine transport system substrate-binding protein